jgi:cysteine-rich repeat protein
MVLTLFASKLDAFIAAVIQVTRWLSSCGNAVVEGLEECDDGDLTDGDGCSASCTIEPGWVCTGSPSICHKQVQAHITMMAKACKQDCIITCHSMMWRFQIMFCTSCATVVQNKLQLLSMFDVQLHVAWTVHQVCQGRWL